MGSENSIKIGELLVRAGVVTGVDLQEAETLAKHMQVQFGRILIMSGCLTEHDLECALEAQSLIKERQLSVAAACEALSMASREQTPLQEAIDSMKGFVNASSESVALAEFLADVAIMTPEQLETALDTCLSSHVPLGQVLVSAHLLPAALVPRLDELLHAVKAGKVEHETAMAEVRKTYDYWSKAGMSLKSDASNETELLKPVDRQEVTGSHPRPAHAQPPQPSYYPPDPYYQGAPAPPPGYPPGMPRPPYGHDPNYPPPPYGGGYPPPPPGYPQGYPPPGYPNTQSWAGQHPGWPNQYMPGYGAQPGYPPPQGYPPNPYPNPNQQHQPQDQSQPMPAYQPGQQQQQSQSQPMPVYQPGQQQQQQSQPMPVYQPGQQQQQSQSQPMPVYQPGQQQQQQSQPMPVYQPSQQPQPPQYQLNQPQQPMPAYQPNQIGQQPQSVNYQQGYQQPPQQAPPADQASAWPSAALPVQQAAAASVPPGLVPQAEPSSAPAQAVPPAPVPQVEPNSMAVPAAAPQSGSFPPALPSIAEPPDGPQAAVSPASLPVEGSASSTAVPQAAEWLQALLAAATTSPPLPLQKSHPASPAQDDGWKMLPDEAEQPSASEPSFKKSISWGRTSRDRLAALDDSAAEQGSPPGGGPHSDESDDEDEAGWHSLAEPVEHAGAAAAAVPELSRPSEPFAQELDEVSEEEPFESMAVSESERPEPVEEELSEARAAIDAFQSAAERAASDETLASSAQYVAQSGENQAQSGYELSNGNSEAAAFPSEPAAAASLPGNRVSMRYSEEVLPESREAEEQPDLRGAKKGAVSRTAPIIELMQVASIFTTAELSSAVARALSDQERAIRLIRSLGLTRQDMVDAAAACCAAMAANRITQLQARAIMLTMKGGKPLHEALEEVGVTPDELLAVGPHRIKLWKWQPRSDQELEEASLAMAAHSFESEASPALDEAMQIGVATNSPTPMALEDFDAVDEEPDENDYAELAFVPELEHDFSPTRHHSEELSRTPIGVEPVADVSEAEINGSVLFEQREADRSPVSLEQEESLSETESETEAEGRDSSVVPIRDEIAQSTETLVEEPTTGKPDLLVPEQACSDEGKTNVFASMMAKWKSKVPGIQKHRREYPAAPEQETLSSDAERDDLFSAEELEEFSSYGEPAEAIEPVHASQPAVGAEAAVPADDRQELTVEPTAEELWLAELEEREAGCKAAPCSDTGALPASEELAHFQPDHAEQAHEAVPEQGEPLPAYGAATDLSAGAMVGDSVGEQDHSVSLIPSAMFRFVEQVSALEDITQEDQEAEPTHTGEQAPAADFGRVAQLHGAADETPISPVTGSGASINAITQSGADLHAVDRATRRRLQRLSEEHEQQAATAAPAGLECKEPPDSKRSLATEADAPVGSAAGEHQESALEPVGSNAVERESSEPEPEMAVSLDVAPETDTVPLSSSAEDAVADHIEHREELSVAAVAKKSKVKQAAESAGGVAKKAKPKKAGKKKN